MIAPACVPPVQVASRTQTMLRHLGKLAAADKAFMKRVQEMHTLGVCDRQKLVDFVRIVSLFNKATGKDTSHGLVDMVHDLLPRVPATTTTTTTATSSSSTASRRGTRKRATAHKPPELDELSCYMISRGGRGAESVFCSEAMKQLFLSTEELKLTLKETGLTSVSVWASFMTKESLCHCNEAVSTVFLQRDTEQLELELECITRTGLSVLCDATVSFRVHENGESTLILSLSVKQDADPSRTLVPPSRSHRGKPLTLVDKEAAVTKNATRSSRRCRTSTSKRLTSQLRKRQHDEEERRVNDTSQRLDNNFKTTARPKANRAAVSNKRSRTTPRESPSLPTSAIEAIAGAKPNPVPTQEDEDQEQEQEKEDALWCSLDQSMILPSSSSDTTSLATSTGSSSSSSSSCSGDEDDEDEDDLFAWAASICASMDVGFGDFMGGAETNVGVDLTTTDPSIWLMLDQPQSFLHAHET